MMPGVRSFSVAALWDAGDQSVFQTGSHIPEEMTQNNEREHGKTRCAPDDVGDRPCSWQGQ
jgi:hypothetical protein